ncbi:hypothetical protein Hokovirus_1_36 [Hokovirus HKV1]|uniref:Uncharacterized protein n=1 Tax=Hokovirus HKV1 TaxID=1977638 RepID=A0A1V0SEL2_9VIRU|nr:hypothetical protein Hokovirus_1_36 [Hokovirus HKV1]
MLKIPLLVKSAITIPILIIIIIILCIIISYIISIFNKGIYDSFTSTTQDIIKQQLEFAYNIKKINNDLAIKKNMQPVNLQFTSNLGIMNVVIDFDRCLPVINKNPLPNIYNNNL